MEWNRSDALPDLRADRGRPVLSRVRHDPARTLLNNPSPSQMTGDDLVELPMTWLPPFWALALPIAASIPLGWSMSRSLDPPDDRVGRGSDALPMFLCRLLGRSERARMDWKQYAVAFLAFNTALFVISFGLL